MKNLFSTLVILLSVSFAKAAFEGTITVQHKNEKNVTVTAEIKVKDSLIYIRQTENGHPKYSGYLINTQSRDFYTIGKEDKKVAIRYHLDSLLAFYERFNLKDGYRTNYGYDYKTSDKSKEENGAKYYKATAEDSYYKVTVWNGTSALPIAGLIPVLRLLGNWNEAQNNQQNIIEADVFNKLSRKESTVRVSSKNESIKDKTFTLPDNYRMEDFRSLMNKPIQQNDMRNIIQSFGEF